MERNHSFRTSGTVIAARTLVLPVSLTEVDSAVVIVLVTSDAPVDAVKGDDDVDASWYLYQDSVSFDGCVCPVRPYLRLVIVRTSRTRTRNTGIEAAINVMATSEAPQMTRLYPSSNEDYQCRKAGFLLGRYPCGSVTSGGPLHRATRQKLVTGSVSQKRRGSNNEGDTNK